MWQSFSESMGRTLGRELRYRKAHDSHSIAYAINLRATFLLQVSDEQVGAKSNSTRKKLVQKKLVQNGGCLTKSPQHDEGINACIIAINQVINNVQASLN